MLCILVACFMVSSALADVGVEGSLVCDTQVSNDRSFLAHMLVILSLLKDPPQIRTN